MTTASLSDQVKWADETRPAGSTGIDVHATRLFNALI